MASSNFRVFTILKARFRKDIRKIQGWQWRVVYWLFNTLMKLKKKKNSTLLGAKLIQYLITQHAKEMQLLLLTVHQQIRYFLFIVVRISIKIYWICNYNCFWISKNVRWMISGWKSQAWTSTNTGLLFCFPFYLSSDDSEFSFSGAFFLEKNTNTI